MVSYMDAGSADRIGLDMPVTKEYATHPDGYKVPKFRLS